LRELEGRFGPELVVIGVHSGKFRAERVTANIAQAADRMDVRHAIVNDRQYRVWRTYGVNAWPTIVIVAPDGGYVGSLPGEFLADQLEPTLRAILAEFEAVGGIGREPLPLALPTPADGPLRFPGKVLAASGGRLFVADSGHDRILELQVKVEGSASDGAGARMDGKPSARVVRVIGSGERGSVDGPLALARFDHPEGMALRHAPDTETLFVADSDNHAIRAVDLGAGEVTTLAGTGLQSRRANEPGAGRGVALSSPWDLALVDDGMIIAMAGAHQLWKLDLATLETGPWVGTGREDISDGPAARCTLAQPMGVSLTGDRLYFADAESSAVRFVDLRSTPDVTTIVGRGLFEFGDEDGKGGRVRLQHPYGVAAHEDVLYVADTYNNKIKRIDLDGRSETFAGDGEEGLRDGELLDARFDEPQGVAVADNLLFVADTNNHAIRVIDLRAAAGSRAQVRTLQITQ
jgi:NHL repeat